MSETLKEKLGLDAFTIFDSLNDTQVIILAIVVATLLIVFLLVITACCCRFYGRGKYALKAKNSSSNSKKKREETQPQNEVQDLLENIYEQNNQLWHQKPVAHKIIDPAQGPQTSKAQRNNYSSYNSEDCDVFLNTDELQLDFKAQAQSKKFSFVDERNKVLPYITDDFGAQNQNQNQVYHYDTNTLKRPKNRSTARESPNPTAKPDPQPKTSTDNKLEEIIDQLNEKILEKNLGDQYLIKKTGSVTDPSQLIGQKLDATFKNTNIEASRVQVSPAYQTNVQQLNLVFNSIRKQKSETLAATGAKNLTPQRTARTAKEQGQARDSIPNSKNPRNIMHREPVYDNHSKTQASAKAKPTQANLQINVSKEATLIKSRLQQSSPSYRHDYLITSPVTGDKNNTSSGYFTFADSRKVSFSEKIRLDRSANDVVLMN